MTAYAARWNAHLSTNAAPEVPLLSLPRCKWCHVGIAQEDGFCLRICRVESWKANGDESDFISEPRIVEALANPGVARVRTVAQIKRSLNQTLP